MPWCQSSCAFQGSMNVGGAGGWSTPQKLCSPNSEASITLSRVGKYFLLSTDITGPLTRAVARRGASAVGPEVLGSTSARQACIAT
eukprot:6195976-Pleurochrysis_carterae.AAC.3